MTPDMFQVVATAAGILFSIVGFLSIRTLRQIDANQEKLSTRLDDGLGEAFERLRAVELDLTGLRAQHKINHGRMVS